MKVAFALASLLVLSSCRDSPYAQMSTDEIHARAQSLPLEKRYDFYLNVLHSRIPEDPTVAEDLTALGPSARAYIIERALAGGREDLQDALPALSEFSGPCTQREWYQLSNKAKTAARNEEDFGLLREHLAVACEASRAPIQWD